MTSAITPKRKEASFSLFRTVRSTMIERYIFNFRIRPDDLAKKLPVPWLQPQAKNDWSVVSFCILWLDRLSVAPLPAWPRLSTISCAYRIGVIDVSGSEPEPSVYVTDRWADLPLIARIAPAVMLDTIPAIKAAIGHEDGKKKTHVQLSYSDGAHLFSAETETTDAMGSEVFDSVEQFAQFIKDGVSSYAPSIYPGQFTKVDLVKEDVAYEPLKAEIEYSELHKEWSDVGMELDSTVRAKGAKYEWTYRGLWSAE